MKIKQNMTGYKPGGKQQSICKQQGEGKEGEVKLELKDKRAYVKCIHERPR
jgi:hypothetical protein